MTRHLIVGAGPAGINAAETIRALDAGADITLVGDERPCARMVLPYFLEGKIEQDAVYTGDAAWFGERKVETRFDARVASVDPEAGKVMLEGGGELPFDRLLVATGSRSARPRIEGLDQEGVVHLWTVDDARSFLARPRGDTVIIGAGFIAFTVLDALVARSARVDFVEIESQVLPHMLDAKSAALLAGHLEANGVGVRTGQRVTGIEAAAGRRRVHLASGDAIDCDTVVVAAGVLPNVELLEGSGVALGDGPGAGVRVDATLQSSVPGIYAAGDVAQAADLLTGEQRVHAVQPTAVDHGRVAGANMAGERVEYAGSLVMNILAARGLEAASFGRWREDADAQVMSNAGNRIYRKYVWEGDRLVGGILVGPTVVLSGSNDVGMLKGLIQTGVPLGPWKDYLRENPLDLRRPFVASGAAAKLLEHSLLTGRASTGRGFRFPPVPAARRRSAHHATLLTGKPA